MIVCCNKTGMVYVRTKWPSDVSVIVGKPCKSFVHVTEIKEIWFVSTPLTPTSPEDLTLVDWNTSWRRIKCRSEAHAEHILSLLESGNFDPEDSAISIIAI